MNPEWNAFLTQIGGTIEPENEIRFDRPRAEIHAAATADIVADLSHTALICVDGTDAGDFLNGQLSTDVRSLEPHQSQISAYCDPKGRVLAVFRVFRHADGYRLRLPCDMRDAILTRLRKYILRARVDLNPADAVVLFGVAGPRAIEILTRIAIDAPQDVGSNGTDLTVMRAPGPWPRYEIAASVDAARNLWTELARHCTATGPSAWRWHDIQAGIPTVVARTSGSFLPQHLNLDLLGGVDFAKGCYPGQEIIARARYLGRIKQRMYRAWTPEDNPPQPGEAVHAADYPSDQAAGKVIAAELAPREGSDLLTVLVSGVAGSETRVGNLNGPTITLQTLPYAPADPN